MLSPPHSINSLFVANNNIAVACLECFQEMNIRIPQDMALVSFDDIDAFKLCYPPVTAVAQPIEEMGREAINMLINEIKNEDKELLFQHLSLQTTLKIRRSCGSFIAEL